MGWRDSGPREIIDTTVYQVVFPVPVAQNQNLNGELHHGCMEKVNQLVSIKDCQRLGVSQFCSFHMLFYSTDAHEMLAQDGIELPLVSNTNKQVIMFIIEYYLQFLRNWLVCCLSYGHGVPLADPTQVRFGCCYYQVWFVFAPYPTKCPIRGKTECECST